MPAIFLTIAIAIHNIPEGTAIPIPLNFGFAAGAMIYLVLTESIPEALDIGSGLPNGEKSELAGKTTVGILVMVPLAFI